MANVDADLPPLLPSSALAPWQKEWDGGNPWGQTRLGCRIHTEARTMWKEKAKEWVIWGTWQDSRGKEGGVWTTRQPLIHHRDRQHPQNTKVPSTRERQLFLPIPGPFPFPPQTQAEEQPRLYPDPTSSCPSIFPEAKAPLWPAGTLCPAPPRGSPLAPHRGAGCQPPCTMLRGCAPLAPLQMKLHSTYLYSSQRQLTRFGAISEHPHWQFSQRPVFKQRQTCLDLLR